MRKFFSLLILSLMVTATVIGAQNPATVRLKGKVLDSTALPMAGTAVKVYQGTAAPKEGVAPFKEGVTNNDGDFDIEVPAGDYYIDVSAPDFTPFKQAVKAAANMQPLAVTLSVQVVNTEITVSNDQGGVGIDQNDSLMTDTITGDALLDLPDNEEDLLAYLTELAAARGLVDGELDIRVDGFGQSAFLPNRNEIAEIRIVNTSFDAAGGGTGPRIEIVTRPGTGVWRGNVGFTFADESLNAAAPLTSRKPASQTRNIDAQLSGPILPGRITATFNIRNQESDSEGNAIRAVTVFGPIDAGISRIQRSRTITFRPTLTINKVHTLVSSFTIGDNRTEGSGIGGFTLPERGTDNRGDNWSMQFTETANLKPTLRNEFRVQLQNRQSSTIPLTNEVAINVQDAFNGGGAPNRSINASKDYFIGNTVRWQASRTVNLTMAAEMNYHKTSNESRNNYLGTYTFAGLHDYCYAENFPGTNCEETRTLVNDALANGTFPTYLNGRGEAIPITGVPTQFRITQGIPLVEVSQAEYAAYMQGEWRAATRAQVSFGLRYQAQQHLNDYNNFAPTVGLSYQLNTKQNWQTVVRVGGRVNYSTYSMGNWEQLLRSSGLGYQNDYLVLNPAYPLPDMSALVAQATGTATTQRIRADNYAAGYSMQPSFSVDQQLPKGHRLSFNFQMRRDVHQNRNRNINAPFPGTPLSAEIQAMLNYRNPLDPVDQQAVRTAGRELVNAMRPDPTVGNISMSESSGSALTKNFSIQYRVNNKRVLWNKVMIGGTVTWNMNWAEDNNGTPVNNYDLAAEWGRSSNDQRHRVTGSVNIQVPWNMRFSFTQVGYNSGRPYTLTLGNDLNGDGSNNDRPQGIGRNTETGPATFNPISMSVTKIIPLGGTRRPTTADDYAEPQRGGGGFGGGGGGGGFGGGGGGNRNTGGRQIEIGANVSNLFNSTVRSGISGVLSSPLFGQPTGGGRGRTITLSIRTNLGQLF